MVVLIHSASFLRPLDPSSFGEACDQIEGLRHWHRVVAGFVLGEILPLVHPWRHLGLEHLRDGAAVAVVAEAVHAVVADFDHLGSYANAAIRCRSLAATEQPELSDGLEEIPANFFQMSAILSARFVSKSAYTSKCLKTPHTPLTFHFLLHFYTAIFSQAKISKIFLV